MEDFACVGGHGEVECGGAFVCGGGVGLVGVEKDYGREGVVLVAGVGCEAAGAVAFGVGGNAEGGDASCASVSDELCEGCPGVIGGANVWGVVVVGDR